jgi:quercetin dioxygenase-like cupin family protein
MPTTVRLRVFKHRQLWLRHTYPVEQPRHPKEAPMSARHMFTLGMALGLALGSGGIAIGQQSPPAENKGVSIGKTTAVDLGPEIPGMQGRQLRLRVVTVDPGGHDNWPEIVYVLQGAVAEHRGGQANEYRAGDTFSGNKDTTHWIENKGTAPAVMIVEDVSKP